VSDYTTPGASPKRPGPHPPKLIFAQGAPGVRGVTLPELDVPPVDLDVALAGRARKALPLMPELAEVDVARHFSALAEVNFGVDTGFYPLGSCTMKYNPRFNEAACRLPGFADLHPYQPESTTQGILELMVELQDGLAEVAGLHATSLQPAAGAHGEVCGLMIIRAWHTANGDPRKRVIIPDTAHGTNPATVAMCGYDVTTVPSDSAGGVDLEALEAALGPDVAAIMLTNPNTLGLFDPNICEINRMVHGAGALAYCDGANLNAVMGVSQPGEMGFDVLHINLHKTFSTPHGGGGPGAGPVVVRDFLAGYLPGPVAARAGDGSFSLVTPDTSIGRVRSYVGNVGVLVRAYAYLRAQGAEGLRAVSEQAVLSANYIKAKLSPAYEIPFDRPCKHEFVASGRMFKREHGIRTLDIAKRLLDYGYHPPTIYFPLLVEEALMIEPTETESKETLDRFIEVMNLIAEEAAKNPELLHGAPYTTPVRRLDEARAVKQPDLAALAGDASPCLD
jgi:glycine dehydrogenase subunit 2